MTKEELIKNPLVKEIMLEFINNGYTKGKEEDLEDDFERYKKELLTPKIYFGNIKVEFFSNRIQNGMKDVLIKIRGTEGWFSELIQFRSNIRLASNKSIFGESFIGFREIGENRMKYINPKPDYIKLGSVDGTYEELENIISHCEKLLKS